MERHKLTIDVSNMSDEEYNELYCHLTDDCLLQVEEDFL